MSVSNWRVSIQKFNTFLKQNHSIESTVKIADTYVYDPYSSPDEFSDEGKV